MAAWTIRGKDRACRPNYRRKDRVVDGYEYRGACSVERKVDFALLADIWNALYQIDGDFSFSSERLVQALDEHAQVLLLFRNARVHAAVGMSAEVWYAAGIDLGMTPIQG